MTIRKVQVGVLFVAFGLTTIGCDKATTADTSKNVGAKEVNVSKKNDRKISVPEGVEPAK